MSYRSTFLLLLGLGSVFSSCAPEEPSDGSSRGDGDGDTCTGSCGDGDGDLGDGDGDRAICEPAYEYKWSACINPRDVAGIGAQDQLTYGVESQAGFVECIDGSINRVTAEPAVLTADAQGGAGGTTFDEIQCLEDEDCSPEEACVAVARWGGGSVARGTECVPAACRSAADCESGECGLWLNGVDGSASLACRSEGDQCRSNDDCHKIWRTCEDDYRDCLSGDCHTVN